MLRRLETEIFRLTTHNSRLTKAIAFTLAETLIVMGIIGIVSALTLPNLNSSTGNKEIVAKVKKIYQNLNDAYIRAEAVYGPVDEWFVNDGDDKAKMSKRLGERMTEFMKISKDCGANASSGCFYNGSSYYLDGSVHGSIEDSSNYYSIITADGTSMLFKLFKTSNNKDSLAIIVDIDGPSKGPNTYGKDLFRFRTKLDERNITSAGYGQTFSNLVKTTHSDTHGGEWILRYDNADYLLFDANGLCPNGNTVTEANPRCK